MFVEIEIFYILSCMHEFIPSMVYTFDAWIWHEVCAITLDVSLYKIEELYDKQFT
jgi:hypothetical protein